MRSLSLFVAALGLLLAMTTVTAEQIKLTDGRFLQGEVKEVTEQGFKFKLTETGGTIFLRWNQVDAALKKRLLNEKDPDEGLNLSVTVKGCRLELVNGEVVQGDISKQGGNYVVKNKDFKAGRSYPDEDVIEGGFVKDVEIDALIMLTEEEVLALAETQRSPLENARQFYELARIGHRLGLYEAAKDYVTLGLGASPDAKLQGVLEQYNVKLDELIRQREILTVLAAARKASAKNKFQIALDSLDEAKKKYNPTGDVLTEFDTVRAEVDAKFTVFVQENWAKHMRIVVKEKCKDKKLTIQEGLAWARGAMDQEIQASLVKETGGVNADIRKRFDARKESLDKLTMKRISWPKEGFYNVIGGHLPDAGNKQPQGSQPSSRQPGQPGGQPRGPSGRDRNVGPAADLIREAMKESAPAQNSDKPPEKPGEPKADDKAVDEMLKKALEELAKRTGQGKAEPPKSKNKQDLTDQTKWKVPANTPSIQDWWNAQSSGTRTTWLTCVYVKFAGVMVVFEEDGYNIKYK